MSLRDEIEQKRNVLLSIAGRHGATNLRLFGSVARGDASPASDLDVLVDFEHPVTLSAFLALEDALAGLTARRVDLISARALKPHIGRRVRAEAVAV